MKTLWNNLKYLWHTSLEQDLQESHRYGYAGALVDMIIHDNLKSKPLERCTPMPTLFTGKHHVDQLSARAITGLSRAGINTVEQLRAMSDKEILALETIGKQTCDYIMTRLYEEFGER